MHYNNITMIGTSHIAKESVSEVKNYIIKEKPDIIALELDRPRLAALLNKKKKGVSIKDLRKIGGMGIIFNLMGAWAEKKLGKLVDTKPGSEMLMAIKLAKQEKILISLIDQDIRITLSKLSKQMPWKEKFRLFFDLFMGNFHKPKKIKIDLNKVPDEKTIKKLTKEFKKRYPSLHQVLVVDRNEAMAKNLYKLSTKEPDKQILAIIGAGHKEDILNLLKNAEKENI
jgi:pheromone shutdown-related protein TraB